MIEYTNIRNIHFVGIGGAGMSGIAEVLHNMGFNITGSDISESDVVKRLKSLGIKIFKGHNENNIKDVETLVFSSAIKEDNPEIIRAKQMKIPVIPRAEMLAELMRLKFSFAIAGTHGKTTTTSMVSCILSEAKKDPTFVVGGMLKNFKSGAKLGKSDYFIAEADESDKSFVKLYSTISIITNIENDHLDNYRDFEELKDYFVWFANKVPFYGYVIVNNDCKTTKRILKRINKRIISFGIKKSSDLMAKDIKISEFGSEYSLYINNEYINNIKLNIGGIHNVYNSLAAISSVYNIGIDLNTIKKALKKFKLPDRRFQILFKDDDFLIVDDYAHHPSEIKTTIKTLKSGSHKRIIGVFQPHRYTRLKLLMSEFSKCFNGLDELILVPLYPAGQKAIRGVNSLTLKKEILKNNKSIKVKYIKNMEDVEDYLFENIKKGDGVVFLSAGNLTKNAHSFAEKWRHS